MVRILMLIFAACAVLGGLDRLLGNRFGLGKAFESGFQMLGPVALSMAGIICLSPVLSQVLGVLVKPLYHLLGQDPAMFGSVLAIDMGGYQMALGLADDVHVGRFAGIIAAAILGCTVSFTIPTGMGMFDQAQRDHFARGILYGLCTLPLSLLMGGLLCGLGFLQTLWLCLPVAVLSALLVWALTKKPKAALKGFSLFAGLLKILTTAGLVLGAFQYISGIILLPILTPLEDSMKIVSAIGIMMLGSLPLAEILQWALKKPMQRLGDKLGIGDAGMAGMLLLYLNTMPGLTAMPRMNPRGRIVSAAFAVSAASCLSAHFAFTMGTEPDLGLPLIVTKLLGGLIAAAFAWCMTRKGE